MRNTLFAEEMESRGLYAVDWQDGSTTYLNVDRVGRSGETILVIGECVTLRSGPFSVYERETSHELWAFHQVRPLHHMPLPK